MTSGGALGFGLRIGIELVAALCVGLALGWLADRYIGTRPWGLIAGFFLGSAAGVVNVSGRCRVSAAAARPQAAAG